MRNVINVGGPPPLVTLLLFKEPGVVIRTVVNGFKVIHPLQDLGVIITILTARNGCDVRLHKTRVRRYTARTEKTILDYNLGVKGMLKKILDINM
jgi:hypothetical protein